MSQEWNCWECKKSLNFIKLKLKSFVKKVLSKAFLWPFSISFLDFRFICSAAPSISLLCLLWY